MLLNMSKALHCHATSNIFSIFFSQNKMNILLHACYAVHMQQVVEGLTPWAFKVTLVYRTTANGNNLYMIHYNPKDFRIVFAKYIPMYSCNDKQHLRVHAQTEILLWYWWFEGPSSIIHKRLFGVVGWNT